MDVNQVVELYHRAADEFARGDPEPIKALWSRGDDVVLANPFGPAVVGWAAVSDALDYASSQFRDGEMPGADGTDTFLGTDLATIHERERWRTKVGGRDDISDVYLRVTTTMRREGDTWRIVLRHADPIDTFDRDGPIRS